MRRKVVHIHWPDSLFPNWSPTELEVLFLEQHLQEIRKHAKVVYTRHNEFPHYSQNPNRKKCYEIVERNADAIVHMGNYGLEEFRETLRNDHVEHFVIPHHIYNNEISNSITREEARGKLKIKLNKFVVLTFGAFRNADEVSMVLFGFRKWRLKNKYLLAPLLGRIVIDERKNKHFLGHLENELRLFKLLTDGIHPGKDFIPDDMVESYFAAADVVLIQRLHILNSGNVSMAFYFKRPVVGPDTGNTGELLRSTGNFVFDPFTTASLPGMLDEAFRAAGSSVGGNNYQYAITNLKVAQIAEKYLDVYQAVLGET